jgi:hypothetical protein
MTLWHVFDTKSLEIRWTLWRRPKAQEGHLLVFFGNWSTNGINLEQTQKVVQVRTKVRNCLSLQEQPHGMHSGLTGGITIPEKISS